jgi:hypothetical protein
VEVYTKKKLAGQDEFDQPQVIPTIVQSNSNSKSKILKKQYHSVFTLLPRSHADGVITFEFNLVLPVNIW